MCSAFDADAQRKRKKRKSRDEKENNDPGVSWKQKMVYEIGFGNLNFGSTFVGNIPTNVFNFSLKSKVGYKINNRFSAGVGGKFYYAFYNFPSNSGIEDFGAFDYGGLVFLKAHIYDKFYLVGEYNWTSFEFIDINFENRKSVQTPMVGIEYLNGLDKWKFGMQVLFVLNDEYRDYIPIGVIDYWLIARYNF